MCFDHPLEAAPELRTKNAQALKQHNKRPLSTQNRQEVLRQNALALPPNAAKALIEPKKALGRP